MFPARYKQTLFIFFMTLLMSLSLSLVFLVLEGGVDVSAPGLAIQTWLTRFGRVYLAVLPAVIIISPVAKRLSAAFVAHEH